MRKEKGVACLPSLRQTAGRGRLSVSIDPLIILYILQLSLKELDQSHRREIKSPQAALRERERETERESSLFFAPHLGQKIQKLEP